MGFFRDARQLFQGVQEHRGGGTEQVCGFAGDDFPVGQLDGQGRISGGLSPGAGGCHDGTDAVIHVQLLHQEQDLLVETKKRFDILNSEITSSVDDINGISSLTENLENIKTQIIENVSDLSAISEENAASTEEVSASMENITVNMRVISENANGMNDIAEDLVESVGEFKF